MKVQITVSIENEDFQDLDALAKEKKRSVRDVIRFAVTDYIKTEKEIKKRIDAATKKPPPVLKAKKKGR